MTDSTDRVPIEPQSIVTPLSKAAVFLVLSLDPAAHALARVIEVISDTEIFVQSPEVGLCDADDGLHRDGVIFHQVRIDTESGKQEQGDGRNPNRGPLLLVVLPL